MNDLAFCVCLEEHLYCNMYRFNTQGWSFIYLRHAVIIKIFKSIERYTTRIWIDWLQ